MPEPEKYLPMNRAELIARCEALEAALRTIAAYRGKNDVAHQLAYIAEAALDLETQPTGNYTDSIDVAESFAAETKVEPWTQPTDTQCWKCYQPYPINARKCGHCGATNANVDLAGAQAEQGLQAKIKGEQIG